MTHYESLGVPKDADPETIRRAYRKRAQKSHPDKGGSKEQFHAVQKAWDVLGDPQRREKYDRQGDDGPMLDTHAMALQSIAALLMQVVDQVDVDHTNIVELMVSNTQQHEQQAKQKLAGLNDRIKKRERALKRFKKKNSGQDMIARMLEADIAQQRIAITNVEREIEVCKKMVEIVSDYNYSADILKTQPGLGNYVTFSFR